MKIIQQYYYKILQSHLVVSKMLQLFQQISQFSKIRDYFKADIKKYPRCQKNKYATYAKYDKIKHKKLLDIL